MRNGLIAGVFSGTIDQELLAIAPPKGDEELLGLLLTSLDRFLKRTVDAARIDREGFLGEDVLDGMRELGLFGLVIPEEYGGLGLDISSYGKVIAKVSAHCGASAVTLGAHQSIGFKSILMAGSAGQERKWLPSLATGERIAAYCLTEAEAGSDAGALRTRLRRDGDDVMVLDGEKIWITNGGIAGLFTVFARDHDGAIRAVLVPRETPGITIGLEEKKLGIRGSSTTSVAFSNVRVPAENLLFGDGFRLAMDILDHGRASLAAGSLGPAQVLLDLATKHAITRRQFGRPLASFGMVRETLAEMALDLCGMQALVSLSGRLIDAGAAVRTAAQGESLARRGQAILQRIEDLDVFVIAALPGLTLGGGLELALACHARVAAANARLGLPEVRVGLLPGLGGTQRLPKLIGMQAALPLMLAGKTVNARRAQKLGLIDALARGKHVRAVAARLKPPARKPKRARIPTFVMKAVAKKRIPSGFEAPHRILRAISRGYAVEARELGQAIASPECKQLVRLFRAATSCREGTKDLAIPRCVGVVGFGTMGAGIASALTRAGIEVRVREIDDPALVRGLRRFRGDRDRLTLTTGWEGFRAAEVMIEVVPEVLALKREILVRMRAAAPGAMLVSNTSSLKVSELGVVGLHFFNPVHKMPLVEVVTGPDTPTGQIRRARALAVALGKTPVVVADSPGFLVNRILGRYLSAASALDASPDAVDAAARAFGFPMGPFEVLDIVGHQVARAVCKQLHGAYGERFAATPRFRKKKRRRARPANLAPALDALRDEAKRCAAERVAYREQIDLACAMGFGYPAWRGPILTPQPRKKEVSIR